MSSRDLGRAETNHGIVGEQDRKDTKPPLSITDAIAIRQNVYDMPARQFGFMQVDTPDRSNDHSTISDIPDLAEEFTADFAAAEISKSIWTWLNTEAVEDHWFSTPDELFLDNVTATDIPIPILDTTLLELRVALELVGLILAISSGNLVAGAVWAKALTHDSSHLALKYLIRNELRRSAQQPVANEPISNVRFDE